MKVRAISLHNPHAQFVAHGFKPFETRHWPANYTGPLLIHAARRPMDDWDIALAREVFDTDTSISWGNCETRFFGAFLCLVHVGPSIQVEKMTENQRRQSNELGNFSEGRWAWPLSGVKRFVWPIPAVGRQRWWTVDFELESLPMIDQPWRERDTPF